MKKEPTPKIVSIGASVIELENEVLAQAWLNQAGHRKAWLFVGLAVCQDNNVLIMCKDGVSNDRIVAALRHAADHLDTPQAKIIAP